MSGICSVRVTDVNILPKLSSSLHAIRYLSECSANREKLKAELGMMLSLAERRPQRRSLLASEVYELLQDLGQALLRIRGVISFTFQMSVKRLHRPDRADLKPEALASAIASTQVMTAQQVVKGENGQEVLVPFPEDSSVQVEQNQDLPEYLPKTRARLWTRTEP
ncbi:hypothetical protein WMY93_009044 [Mugilogobius chulae]|uniref:Uncharacterized protein n=1 Tax=Mugilogobius chulae TaxID=88201 RepID=A0AAW0PDQ6_9GOBI